MVAATAGTTTSSVLICPKLACLISQRVLGDFPLHCYRLSLKVQKTSQSFILVNILKEPDQATYASD
jgi:hypothetical protein